MDSVLNEVEMGRSAPLALNSVSVEIRLRLNFNLLPLRACRKFARVAQHKMLVFPALPCVSIHHTNEIAHACSLAALRLNRPRAERSKASSTRVAPETSHAKHGWALQVGPGF